MEIVCCFIKFFLSIFESMSQFLPRSSYSPPAQPQIPQTTSLESPTPVPVVARQNIEQQNLHINMNRRKWANAPFKKKYPAFCPISETN